jgi:hypothetical protein
MATRAQRLAEFNEGGCPPEDEPVEVLCEDKSGTYKLPFACRWQGSTWQNCETGATVEATVVGWRWPTVNH